MAEGKVSSFKKPKATMKYHPDDDTYSDRFNEPDQHRAIREGPQSFNYVYWMVGGVFITSQIVLWIFISLLYKGIAGFAGGTPMSFIGALEYLMFFAPHKGLAWIFVMLVTFILTGVSWYWLWRNFKVQNMLNDTSDLNQYHNDSRLTQPEELIHKFSVVPDVGAHSKNGDLTAVLGHMMINNNGIKPIEMFKRYKRQTVDEDGTIHYANTLVRDADGNPIKETVPLFDKDFGDELYDSAGVPSSKTSIGKRIRLWYDPRKLLFNPGNDVQGELKGREFFDQLPFSTLADVINNDWWMPSYEVQRPAGVYVVDSAPANTMVCQHC